MSEFVLDSSVALAWCFDDKTSAETDALLDRLSADDAIVPTLWGYEMRNALLAGERRGRLDEARTSERLAFLGQLPIRAETVPPQMLDSALAFARRHKLTVYDAAYLELAMRLGAPLATLDNNLRRAAKDAGISLLPA